MTESVQAATPLDDLSDEDLIAALAGGDEGALGPLHARYAGLIFGLASRSLDRPTAEEIVQDVLVTVWRKADTYDRERGPVRPWILRIAHLRVITELRRRGRRPQIGAASRPLDDLYADGGPSPDDVAWREYRRAAIRTAVAALPPPQRQALSLAFFGDLTHEQVAAFLGVPLGTAKTRIRTGLRRLRRPLLGLFVITALLTAGLAVVSFQSQRRLADLRRHEDALAAVTNSDTAALRMVPAAGTPAAERDTHATYRSRADSDVAVLTFSHFTPPPPGRAYQAWARVDGTWRPLATVGDFDASGRALVVLDRAATFAPDDVTALEVTVEPAGGSAAPTGPVVVSWSPP